MGDVSTPPEAQGFEASIVGPGRIGLALNDALASSGASVELVGRGERVLKLRGPVVVTTRLNDLPEAIQAAPQARLDDLVLLQNGDLLATAAELPAREVTLGVLWIAVSARGASPRPGRGCMLSGRWAPALADRLSEGGIPAQAVSDAELRRELALKLLWLSIAPVLAARDGETVGASASARADEIAALTAELAPIAGARFGVALPPRDAARILLGYSASIPEWSGGVKELESRNHLLVAWGGPAVQPRHLALLQEVGALPPV